MSFTGHCQQWLITDRMAVSSGVECACVFPAVAGAMPGENSLGLTGGSSNQERLAQLEHMGSGRQLLLAVES